MFPDNEALYSAGMVQEMATTFAILQDTWEALKEDEGAVKSYREFMRFFEEVSAARDKALLS